MNNSKKNLVWNAGTPRPQLSEPQLRPKLRHCGAGAHKWTGVVWWLFALSFDAILHLARWVWTVASADATSVHCVCSGMSLQVATVETLKDVKDTNEMTVDYGSDYDFGPGGCQCGSRKCRRS